MSPQQNSGAESSDSSAAIIAILKLSMKIVGSLLAIIIALIGTAYWGIDSRLKSLEDHFQAAIVASADVKHLLPNPPI